MSKTRLLKATVLAAAGLVLSGCGGLSPGVAVEVGDETISTTRIDTAAANFCTALADQLEAQGAQVPMGFVRQSAVQLLTVRSIADQIGDEYDVKAGSSYHSAVGEAEIRASSMPEDVREDYIELSTANVYATDILEQVGGIRLEESGVSESTQEQRAQAGMDVFAMWPDANGLEFDPRFGVESVEGVLRPVDTNTSTAVSENALAGLKTEPDAAYAQTLPESHRCG